MNSKEMRFIKEILITKPSFNHTDGRLHNEPSPAQFSAVIGLTKYWYAHESKRPSSLQLKIKPFIRLMFAFFHSFNTTLNYYML